MNFVDNNSVELFVGDKVTMTKYNGYEGVVHSFGEMDDRVDAKYCGEVFVKCLETGRIYNVNSYNLLLVYKEYRENKKPTIMKRVIDWFESL